jgi:hypothetical protein
LNMRQAFILFGSSLFPTGEWDFDLHKSLIHFLKPITTIDEPTTVLVRPPTINGKPNWLCPKLLHPITKKPTRDRMAPSTQDSIAYPKSKYLRILF